MQLTRYQHACFSLEKNNQLVMVDPGSLTKDLPKLTNLLAIVITHKHPDHCDPELLNRLHESNPELKIYTHQAVVSTLPDALPVQLVSTGDRVEAGPFSLEFFGTKHATIHASIAQIDNLGVMIDDKVYYPGDAFTDPERPVQTLLLPIAAPWLKLAESIDFLNRLDPDLAIPTHDAVLSEDGKQIVDRVIGNTIATTSNKYARLVEPITT